MPGPEAYAARCPVFPQSQSSATGAPASSATAGRCPISPCSPQPSTGIRPCRWSMTRQAMPELMVASSTLRCPLRLEAAAACRSAAVTSLTMCQRTSGRREASAARRSYGSLCSPHSGAEA